MSSNENASLRRSPRLVALGRQSGKAMRRVISLVQSRTFLGGLIVVIALLLVAAHGFLDPRFKVDEITLGLLVFASLPLLYQMVTSFKAGNVEVAFRDLSVHDQVFTFLDGIATKRQWTFFTPRAGEESLGPAFVVLTEQLLTHSRQRLVAQLRKWLSSDDVNQRWFAAEIVGYHKITELRRATNKARETEDVNEMWAAWELNCLWAVSRFDEDPYASLKLFLAKTSSRSNQAWVLRAFDQMIESRIDGSHIFADAISALSRRLDNEGVSLEDKLSLVQGLQHVKPLLIADGTS